MKKKILIFLFSILLFCILTIIMTNKRSKNRSIKNNRNSVIRYSGDEIYFTNSVWAALHDAIDGDTIIFNGCFNEKPQSALYSRKLTKAVNNLSIIGISNSIIIVTQQSTSANCCSMSLRGITNLYLKNINLKHIIQAFNNNTYGLVLSGSQNVKVDNCTIQSEIYGTNNKEKTFVAVAYASNIIVRNSTIISIDMTGSNKIYHTATHNAQPTIFRNCKFIAGSNTSYTVGKAIFQNCKGNFPAKYILPLSSNIIRKALLGSDNEIKCIDNKINR